MTAGVRRIEWAASPHPLEAVLLENDCLAVTIIPTMGGHVASLVDREADRELLWRNPRMTPRLAPYGAWFDDWWTGGWDEIFPAGDLSEFRGERLPYMGEVWCLPWACTHEVSDATASVTTVVETTIAPARFERTLSLRGDEPILRADYRITNLDHQELAFTWGVHPAFAVADGHVIDHGGRRMVVGEASGPSLGRPGQTYDWPWLPDAAASDRRDMRRVPPATSLEFGGHWADLEDGWISIVDPSVRRGVRMEFDPSVFPYAWCWLVNGGWRGHQLAALECWTSLPMSLQRAMAAGTQVRLGAGDVLSTSVLFRLLAA